ncbi:MULTISPECIES: hypothetical protein [unclassified Streptomyces]|uniref:DUF6891 domain-containing protein n=1 Tax=unclassified Streptomyces TaxID=2593676 RepID=UPI000DC76D75|nr:MULTISPECIES: hypothetical protein [unclassified Streptomyces]AWZ09523.1 hypothetical protein DRB89_39465 [Streptomyces sp. ICC4]AWZ16218.1 hypothetical protein DRB96_32735 [Streptomyces sp. ICC1]
MLAITVRTERGHSHRRPALRSLSDLVVGLGGAGDRFLVVERIPSDPDVYLQVWREGGGDYQLEHRAGSPERHFQAYLTSADEVVELMALWARREEDWDLGPAWERLDFPAEAPAEPLPPEVERQLEEAVRGWLRGGYDDRAALTERAEEHLADGNVRPVSREQAAQLVVRLWRERVAEQDGWAGETDPERVARAFAALGAAGITAREDFACCRGCGLAEIRGDGPPDARGFVFFHAQCTQGAADGGDLYLLYGAFATGDDAADEVRTAAVGREVVAALDAVGLESLWDGSAHDAIRVTGLDWRKRLTG